MAADPQVDPLNLTVNAVLIGMASVVGLALLLNVRTWWQVADSVLNSQRKRLHRAANNLNALKSEGFMKVPRERGSPRRNTGEGEPWERGNHGRGERQETDGVM